MAALAAGGRSPSSIMVSCRVEIRLMAVCRASRVNSESPLNLSGRIHVREDRPEEAEREEGEVS
jgi:hypothetical protein